MLDTLPFAIRIVCLNALFTFTNDSLVNYLSATEREHIANISYGIQIAVNIGSTLLLARVIPMDAPWYGAMIANVCACLFLFVAGRLLKGMFRMHRENVAMLAGGTPEAENVEQWKAQAAEVLSAEQMAVVEEKLFPAFEKAIGEERPHACSFTVLNRDDGDVSVIMRFDHKVGLFAGEFEEEADEEELSRVYDTVVVSEFNTLHRLMINFKAA